VIHSKPENYRPILSIEADAKTTKGSDHGWITGIFYAAPAETSGVINACPAASPGCKAGCLFTAGRARFQPNVNEGRISKTVFMVQNPDAFTASLKFDIERLENMARKRGLLPAVRLNGTSDLPKLAVQFADMFPGIQFYDYTKIPKPWLKGRTRPNYHVTFSRSENNLQDCLDALKHGVNVAVVFGGAAFKALPSSWYGYPVVSGDGTDLRFTDPAGHVIALKAKGRARKDRSGFVINELGAAGLVTIQASMFEAAA
jgi:hypothetical protein